MRCEACGQMEPLPGCLHLTESAVAVLDPEGVIAVHGWLSATLRRPPLVNGGEAWEPLRSVLEGLQRDLTFIPAAVDPASPVVDGLGMVPQPHPAMAAAEAGIETWVPVPGHVEARVVDGWGVERS